MVIAWALYVLLAPVNRSLSLLTAWFQLVYAAVALCGTLNLVTVFRLLNTPEYLTFFGSTQLHAQVYLLVNSFQYDWAISMVLFGIHLVLLGLLDLPVWLHPQDIGNFAGNRWIGLGDREFEAVPFSERPSRIPLYHVLG